jgi:hypothetical protein
MVGLVRKVRDRSQKKHEQQIIDLQVRAEKISPGLANKSDIFLYR